MAYQYGTINTRLDAGVLTAVISNPPVNVMTVELFTDLIAFTAEVAIDEAVRVVVLESADPEFFIAHFDLELILTFPTDKPAVKAETLNEFNQMCERVRTMPKPTIAKIAGRVGGGGSEFSAACDMRFGLHEKTVVNQMEVPLGILPGGGGTQYLPRLMGRGRAMELILGGVDMDAELAERWGYLNRAFETLAALDKHVDDLARRMASWPPEALGLAKQSVLNAELPLEQGLLEEAFLFQQSLRFPKAGANMHRALVLGAQTRDGELDIAELGVRVNLPDAP